MKNVISGNAIILFQLTTVIFLKLDESKVIQRMVTALTKPVYFSYVRDY